MPGRHKILKLKAFALIESLTAVTLLSIAMTATFMTFEWVLNTNRMTLEVQADAILRLMATETKKNGRFVDEVMDTNGWKIERKVLDIPDIKHSFVLHLSAIDEHGKTIAVYDEIIYAP